MTDQAYEKLATRARDLLSQSPRPSNIVVVEFILLEIAAEFRVPVVRTEDFVERLRPAMVGIVSSVRSALVKEQVVETVRPYFARALPSAEPPANTSAMPTGSTPASALGDGHLVPETQHRSAVPEPGAHSPSGSQWTFGAPAPASGGQQCVETQGGDAAQPEPGRTDGDQEGLDDHRVLVAPSAPEPAATLPSAPIVVAPSAPGGLASAQTIPTALPPATPLSLRMDVLDGWRSLRDEPLFVPEHGEVTWGAATREQWHRRLRWHHDQAHGHIESAKRERKALELIEATPGAVCLNDVLDGRALAGRGL